MSNQKRLLELGLPVNSADCAYRGPNMPITILYPNQLYSEHEKEIHDLETKRDRREGLFQTCEPCWSVGRLIDILSNSQGWKPKRVSIPESAINNQIDFLIKCIETAVFLNNFYYWKDKPETLHEIAELVCNRKLRGFFILRNGKRINSNELRSAEKNSPITTHIYWLRTNTDDLYNMYDYNLENVYGLYNSLDVVDFLKLDE